MMKRWIVLMLAVSTMFSLCACGEESQKTESSVASVVSQQQHKLSITPSDVTLYAGGTQKLSIQLDGKGVALAKYNWKSENKKIADIDPNGVVTGIIPGICNIVAFSIDDPTLQAAIQVTVLDAAPTVESSTESKTESDAENSDSSNTESDVSEISSAESSTESGSEASKGAAASIFTTDNPSYDKTTLDAVHSYIQQCVSNNSLIPTDGLTAEQAQMIVNTIYATYGYSFSVGESMNNSYTQCDWYKGTSSDVNEVINNMGNNQTIKTNIDRLGSYIHTLG